MAYEARSNEELEEMEQRAQSNAANQKAIQAGMHAAANSDGVIGTIAKAGEKADDLTGGAVSRKAGELATDLNKVVPGAQAMTNKLANSELADKAYDAYQARQGKSADDKAKEKAAEKAAEAKGPKEAENQAKKGGDQKESLPSSDGKNTPSDQNKKDKDKDKDSGSDNNKDKDNKDAGDEDKEKKDGSGAGLFAGLGISGVLLPIVIALAPIIVIFFLIFGLFSTVSSLFDFDDAFTVSSIAGNSTGGLEVSVDDPDKKAFGERIVAVVNKFQENGKTVDPLMITSVYHALNLYDEKITYSTMDVTKITKIANAMFEDNIYSETTFINNLKSSIIPSYLPGLNEETKNEFVKEVFNYVEGYNSLIGSEESCITNGTCTYNIKGFYINGSMYKKEMNVSNLYVRLMQCGSYDGNNAGGNWGSALDGEDLIPFEKYVLGVAYQKMGKDATEEAFKTQLVAARSFALTRPTQMASSTEWRSLKQEDGKWILQVASCAADQVYCDPDKGCSSATGNAQYEQVYSGTDHGKKIKDALPGDSLLRKYASDTRGITLVNKQGYIVSTDYTDKEVKQFTTLSNEGLDYKQILVQVYSKKYSNVGSLSLARTSCDSCEVNTEYASWKQTSKEWSGVAMGNSGRNIGQIGCLVTSISIQIARSGVQTNISNFNPGTFVQALSKQNGFGAYGDLLSYTSVQNIAPAFKYQNSVSLAGMSKDDKLNTIRSIVNQKGVYAVMEVKGNTGQHWVAVESVEGDKIKIYDPGSNISVMWCQQYPWSNTSRIVYYKVG